MISSRIDAAAELYHLNLAPNSNMSMISEVETINKKSQQVVPKEFYGPTPLTAYQSTPNLHCFNSNNSLNSKMPFQSTLNSQYQVLNHQGPQIRFTSQVPQNFPSQPQMNIPPQNIMTNMVKAPSVTASYAPIPVLTQQNSGQLPSTTKRTARTQSHVACL